MGAPVFRSKVFKAPGFVPVAPRKLDPEVMTALRMGCYQLAFLDRIPGHAIVHESVELVKQARKRSSTIKPFHTGSSAAYGERSQVNLRGLCLDAPMLRWELTIILARSSGDQVVATGRNASESEVALVIS